MASSEKRLLERLRERDELAFSEVVTLHGDKVFNLVLRMVGNRSEAEDIAQEVFVTVFKSIDTFRGESKLTTWLLRIAANHAKNRIKYLSLRATDAVDLEAMPDRAAGGGAGAVMHGHVPPPDMALEAAQTEDMMQKAIGALAEDHRLLLILRDIEELSYEEICDITGLAVGTVKSRLHRARNALKEHLEDKVK